MAAVPQRTYNARRESYAGHTMALFNDAGQNRLLAAMPHAEWQRWWPQLELVNLSLGQVLYEPGEAQSHVYFPATAIVSLLYVLKSGVSAEIAMVGNEGMAGISLFMGGESVPIRAVVQCPGRALRLQTQFVKDEFEHASTVFQLMLRHTQVLLTQMAQTLVCSRSHSLQQQLSRWLLQNMDRLPHGDAVAVPPGQVAQMLGASDAAVAEQIRLLQDEGLVRSMPNRISVPNRPALEARSCKCYLVMRDECDRLLGEAPSPAFVRH